MRYKRVLIIGKDMPNPIASLQLKEDWIVIGGEEGGFTLADLDVLKGRVDFNTRVDISAHGTKHNNSHYIAQDHEPIKTLDLLSRLKLLSNNQPLYIHLWCCYGGDVSLDRIWLPGDSIFVTHIAADRTALIAMDSYAILQSFKNGSEPDPYTDLARDILRGSMSGSMTMNFMKSHPTSSFSFPNISGLSGLISRPRQFIEDKLTNIKERAKVRGITLVIPKFTDEEIDHFIKGHLIYLASFGSIELKQFLEKPTLSKDRLRNLLNVNPFRLSALIGAATNSRLAMARLLIDSGIDLNAHTAEGITALSTAAQQGHHEIVKLLLDAGANANIPFKNKSAALHIAAIRGHKEVIQLLISAKANLDARACDGATALYIAAQEGNYEIVKLLLDAGAHIDILLQDESTALHIAAIRGHKEVVLLLITAKANLNARTIDGATALYIAAQKGHEDIVKMLLEAGADPLIPLHNGFQAFQIATQNGHTKIASLINSRLEQRAEKARVLAAVTTSVKDDPSCSSTAIPAPAPVAQVAILTVNLSSKEPAIALEVSR